MLKAVTISVIIGTFLIGSYYVAASSFVAPVQHDRLALALGEVQPGLTYEKFITSSEDEKYSLLAIMSSDTRRMILDEARDRASFISEGKDEIISYTGPDTKMITFTQVSGIKGYDAQGTASVFVGNDAKFLRLEDFGVAGGIDQHVYLTKDGTPGTGIDVGLLKATQGDQNYDITSIDPNEYHVLIIYSNLFDAYYAHAELLKTE